MIGYVLQTYLVSVEPNLAVDAVGRVQQVDRLLTMLATQLVTVRQSGSGYIWAGRIAGTASGAGSPLGP